MTNDHPTGTAVNNNLSPIAKLKIALVGCGQIADAHLQEIRKIAAVELVAVCDSHRDLAEQAALRFDIPAIHTDIEAMVRDCQPDVVHITTPAHTHLPIAERLLELGCHIYVEKPFTINANDARRLVSLAEQSSRMVTVGHDQLFDPMWLEAKRRIAADQIGDVQHVESLLTYPMSGNFGTQVKTDPNHWVRKLPGGLFQNTISHPLYRITDLLTDETPDVHAIWRKRDASLPIPTELRVEFFGKQVTGSLTFLSSAKPAQRITRVYGTKGNLEVDFDSQTLRRKRAGSLPGAFEKLLEPWRQFTEATGNLCRNCWRFAKSDIHYFAGMRELFEQFYHAVRTGQPLPIPTHEIVRVTRLMDVIFEQCEAESAQAVSESGTVNDCHEAETKCEVTPCNIVVTQEVSV